jgi:hypothetical protein
MFIQTNYLAKNISAILPLLVVVPSNLRGRLSNYYFASLKLRA